MTVPSKFVQIGKIYKHYKGKKYQVIAIAHDTEDPSLKRVIYKALYDCPTFGLNAVWDRPYDMFIEDVCIDGRVQPRFEEVI